MAASSAVQKRNILKGLGTSTACGDGGCSYTLVDGVYQLDTGSCSGPNCNCPRTSTVVAMVIRELLYPASVSSPDGVISKTTACSTAVFVPASDEELLAATRKEIERGPFWMRVSIVLFIVSLLLVGGLIYVLFLR